MVAGATAMLCACGGYRVGGSPSPSPSPPAASPPGLGFDVVVTEQDRTATLHVGQRLEVVLHAHQGMSPWTRVQALDVTVLRPTVNPAATAIVGVTLAAFQAVGAGETTVTAYAGPLCPSPGQACPMYVQVYSLRVTVTPA